MHRLQWRGYTRSWHKAMLMLRIIGVLVVIVIGSSVVAWLFTHDRRYLSLALRVAKGALLAGLAILVLMAAERLILLA